MSVNRSSENMLTHALLPFLFFSHSFTQIFRHVLVVVIFFVLWVTNVIYQNLMLLIFRRQKTFFFCKHNFLYWWETNAMKFRYKAKVFHEFHVSWNVPETVFHGTLWKKTFPVYSCLKDCFNKHGYNFDDVRKNGYSRPS